MKAYKKIILALMAIVSGIAIIEARHGHYHGGYHGHRGYYGHRGHWGRGWGWGWGAPTVGLAIGAAAAANANDDYYERDSYRDDEGRDYWTVKNATNQAILVRTPGDGYKRIEPGKSRQIQRGKSFKLKVETVDGKTTSLTTENHYVTIGKDDI